MCLEHFPDESSRIHCHFPDGLKPFPDSVPNLRHWDNEDKLYGALKSFRHFWAPRTVSAVHENEIDWRSWLVNVRCSSVCETGDVPELFTGTTLVAKHCHGHRSCDGGHGIYTITSNLVRVATEGRLRRGPFRERERDAKHLGIHDGGGGNRGDPSREDG